MQKSDKDYKTRHKVLDVENYPRPVELLTKQQLENHNYRHYSLIELSYYYLSALERIVAYENEIKSLKSGVVGVKKKGNEIPVMIPSEENKALIAVLSAIDGDLRASKEYAIASAIQDLHSLNMLQQDIEENDMITQIEKSKEIRSLIKEKLAVRNTIGKLQGFVTDNKKIEVTTKSENINVEGNTNVTQDIDWAEVVN